MERAAGLGVHSHSSSPGLLWKPCLPLSTHHGRHGPALGPGSTKRFMGAPLVLQQVPPEPGSCPRQPKLLLDRGWDAQPPPHTQAAVTTCPGQGWAPRTSPTSTIPPTLLHPAFWTTKNVTLPAGCYSGMQATALGHSAHLKNTDSWAPKPASLNQTL